MSDAVVALGKIGPEAKDAVPALTELLNDKNENVRSAAAIALGGIGPAAKKPSRPSPNCSKMEIGRPLRSHWEASALKPRAPSLHWPKYSTT